MKGPSDEANAVAQVLRQWLDRENMRVDDALRKLTPEHFADGRIPSRSTMSERLAGIGLQHDFVEAIADICSHDATGRDRLLAQADSARRDAVAALRETARADAALENQLVLVQQRSIAVSDKLVRAMERASQLERERNDANQMVFVLLAMVDKLHRDVDMLGRERDRLHVSRSVHLELEQVQARLVRSEQQRTTAEAELERARTEREKADRLAEEAAEQVRLLTEELERLRGQAPDPDAEDSVTMSTVAPDLRDTLNGASDDIDLALLKASRHLDDRADRLDQLASELHMNNAPDNSPASQGPADNLASGDSIASGRNIAAQIPALSGPSEFEAFCRIHYPAYLAWAHTYLGDQGDAETAVTSVFEELLDHWSDLLKRAYPESDAWQVMKRQIRRFASASGKHEAHLEPTAYSDALREVIDPGRQVDDVHHLFKAIRRLPEDQRDIVVLVHLHGYSVKNAAYHLGAGEGRVNHLDHQARRAMRHDLGIRE
ncbi:sigma factor-like helix-turn-helix DNA-binding protein [Streptomyces sp. NPDC059922]|uniref:sigma factor-like helix-turn-helix DNA-binding protein n=1 Tax=Streptomyces sp. NPDC059922 TaxID=3347005 RepID=UPI003651DF77